MLAEPGTVAVRPLMKRSSMKKLTGDKMDKMADVMLTKVKEPKEVCLWF